MLMTGLGFHHGKRPSGRGERKWQMSWGRWVMVWKPGRLGGELEPGLDGGPGLAEGRV